jgi:hypothetical protein
MPMAYCIHFRDKTQLSYKTSKKVIDGVGLGFLNLYPQFGGTSCVGFFVEKI